MCKSSAAREKLSSRASTMNDSIWADGRRLVTRALPSHAASTITRSYRAITGAHHHNAKSCVADELSLDGIARARKIGGGEEER
jgi:predicted secreted protein